MIESIRGKSSQYCRAASTRSDSVTSRCRPLGTSPSVSRSKQHPIHRHFSDLQARQLASPCRHRWSANQSRKLSRAPLLTQMPMLPQPMNAPIELGAEDDPEGQKTSHIEGLEHHHGLLSRNPG